MNGACHIVGGYCGGVVSDVHSVVSDVAILLLRGSPSHTDFRGGHSSDPHPGRCTRNCRNRRMNLCPLHDMKQQLLGAGFNIFLVMWPKLHAMFLHASSAHLHIGCLSSTVKSVGGAYNLLVFEPSQSAFLQPYACHCRQLEHRGNMCTLC